MVPGQRPIEPSHVAALIIRANLPWNSPFTWTLATILPNIRPVIAAEPPAQKVTNQELAGQVRQTIRAMLEERPESDHIDFGISVRRGEARLEGTVSSAELKVMAEEAALSVPGILRVQNLLSVREVPESPERQ
jgi:hypothetical protein